MLLTVPDFHRETKKTGMERSGPTTSACPAGAAQAEHLLLLRKATAAGLVLDTCTCWFVSVCLSPPTSGLAWRGRRRGAHCRPAGRGVAFYASRRRLRAWPGGGGAHSWTEVFLSTPLYTSRRRLRAWPGGVGGGARNWTGNSRSTPLVADFGPGPNGAAGGAQLDAEFAFHAPRRQLRAWPAPLRCELNLLGRTCGAGKNICKNFKCNNKEYTSYYFNISINRQTH